MITYETIYDLPDILDEAYGTYYQKAEDIARECSMKLKAKGNIIAEMKGYNHIVSIYEKILELSELITDDYY
jgi:hypothetical protein